MNMNHLRLVTFDVTETLLNFRVSPFLKYAEIGAQHGVNANSAKLAENFKKQWKNMTISHPNFGQQTIGWERWWRDVVINTFQGSVEDKIDQEILNKVSSHLIELYKTPECWKTTDGAHELLSYLNKNDIPLGIISNFDDRLETILRAMDLHHYFKFVITSYNCGFQKPDCHIFQLALSQLQIEPSSALHVGNTPETDYMGAINAGWNAVLVHHELNIIQKYPDINPKDVFPTLKDLQLYLQT